MQERVMTIDAAIMPFLARLTETARARLDHFAAGASTLPDGAGAVFHPIDFTDGTGVAALTLSVSGTPSTRDAVNCEMWLDDETRWRNGTLQLPCGRMPDSVIAAMPGRRLHEIAGGTPIIDAVVEEAVNSGARVRLTCAGNKVPLDLAQVGRVPDRIVEPDVEGLRVDPIAAHVLRTMPRARAMHALAWLRDACPRDKLDCGLPWDAFVEAMPPHLASTSTTWGDPTTTGRVLLEISDDTINVTSELVDAETEQGLSIGKWRITSVVDHGPAITPTRLLGFPLRGLRLLHRMDGTGDEHGLPTCYIVSPATPVRQALDLE